MCAVAPCLDAPRCNGLTTCPLPHRTPAAAWIARQQTEGRTPCSPLTGLPLAHLFLASNRALRTLSASLRAAGLLP